MRDIDRFMRALFTLALGLAAAAPAQAQCGADESPSVGVVLRRCAEDGARWIEVAADLASADVGTRVSRPMERGAVVETWAGSVVSGAVIAVPAGPFRFADFEPRGLTVGAGEHWGTTADDPRLGVLALDERQAGVLAPGEQVVPLEPWMHDVLSGVPVLRDGVPAACRGDGCARAPRTGVGLSEDGRTLVIVTAAGWAADAEGVSDQRLGALLAGAGAHDGVRVAEGATSAMWAREDGLIVASSDGASRASAAFLALVDLSAGVTGQLVGVVERMDDNRPLVGARIVIETSDGTVAAEGGTLTDRAYWSFTLPARDYVVRASVDGFRSSCRVCSVEAGGETWCSQFMVPGEGSETCAPPPLGRDAGPWPVGDGGVPVDGSVAPPGSGGCAVGRGETAGGAASVAWLLLALFGLRRR